jgi:hypothetical protein
MAIVFIEGFDYYSSTVTAATSVAAKWSINSGSSASLVSGRFAGLAFQHAGSTQRLLTRTVPATSTLAFGYALKIDDLNAIDASRQLLEFRDAATGIQFGIGINTSRQLFIYRGSIGTVLATGTGAALTQGTWHYIEVEATINNSTGAVTVYVDGASYVSVSGTDTQGQAGSTMDTVRIYACAATSAFPNNFNFDDIYYCNTAAVLGECRVDTLRPTADTADKDWSRSTGSDNFALVDETQANGDTDYVSSATVGHLDFYTLGDLSITPTTIHAVQVNMLARKDDAATREIRTPIRSNGTVANGTPRAMSSTYQIFGEIHAQDPDIAGAWTASAVNALEAGVEVVT